MPKHIVQDGECVLSLAEQHGLFWQTLWDHPENGRLKREREWPQIIYPGDEVFIPERRRGEMNGPAEERHRFVRKGTPAKLRLRFLSLDPPEGDAEGSEPHEDVVSEQDETEAKVEVPGRTQDEAAEGPRANVPFTLKLDGRLFNGTTDSEGYIDVSIPPTARQGTLILEPGTDRVTVVPLRLGSLDPLTELRGVKERLANLGFESGDRDEEETLGFAEALAAYQEAQGLDPTGRLDDVTRDSLQSAHGS